MLRAAGGSPKVRHPCSALSQHTGHAHTRSGAPHPPKRSALWPWARSSIFVSPGQCTGPARDGLQPAPEMGGPPCLPAVAVQTGPRPSLRSSGPRGALGLCPVHRAGHSGRGRTRDRAPRPAVPATRVKGPDVPEGSPSVPGLYSRPFPAPSYLNAWRARGDGAASCAPRTTPGPA